MARPQAEIEDAWSLAFTAGQIAYNSGSPIICSRTNPMIRQWLTPRFRLHPHPQQSKP